jgi:geranylgeranyl reductase family protein
MMSQMQVHLTNRGEPHRYDVIVVGAGPAGATSARACARGGLKTLLLDKDAFPRQKPCAGAVSARALALLDFPLSDDVIERECFGARIGCENRSVVVRKHERIAVLVSRDRFDRFLTDKAIESGARFLTGERVVAVTETVDAVTVSTDKNQYAARFVIGADGIHSAVARSVRPPFRKDELALAVVCNSPADDGLIDERQRDIITLDFGLAPLGYGWLFPHRGYFSAGIAGRASEFSGPREKLSEYGRSLQVKLDSIRGHFIPLGGIKRKIAADRTLLAGDAAGFADAFHGEGIVHAVLSGKLAAGAILDSLKRNEPAHAAARYSRECERLIRKQLRISLYLALLLDRFPKFFLRIFFDNAAALDRYLDIPAGRTDYRRFLRWLVVRMPFYLLSSFLKGLRRSHRALSPCSSIENKGS